MSKPSNWTALCRLADATYTSEALVTQIRGRHPEAEIVDNGGAQARCIHDDEFEGVVLSNGERVALTE